MHAVPAARAQVTLFAPASHRAALDTLRRALDPVQAALIGAHVTLCREDELAGREAADVWRRVAAWRAGPLRLELSAVACIEQRVDAPWSVLREAALGAA